MTRLLAAFTTVFLAVLWLQAGARAQEPLYSEQDLQFIRGMIHHHQQAVEMAALVPERSERDAFRRFSAYVGRAQAAEIRLMESFLAMAAQRGQTLPEHEHHEHAHHVSMEGMAGMLSPAQMQTLAEADGEVFERLWLQGMIYHHEGAITMAQEQQIHQRETGRRPYGLDVLVENILIEQRAEIHRMQGWLEEWGLD